MKTKISIISAILAVFIATSLTSFSFAENVSNCDRVVAQVRASVEKNPQKVLIILEDAMVANEGCAGEIVKACILASHANTDLTKQIVLTATNLAPKMGVAITESAASVAPDQSGAIADGDGKTNEKDVLLAPVNKTGTEADGSRGSDDYRFAPQDIRGVYLIQPSTGTAVTTSTTKPTVVVEKQVVYKKVSVHRAPVPVSVPQSQSCAKSP